MTKRRAYAAARTRLGLTGSVDTKWRDVQEDTTFRWAGLTLDETLDAALDLVVEHAEPWKNTSVVVFQAFCQAFGVSQADMKADVRVVPIARPRMLAMALACHLDNNRWRVGRVFDRDPTTVFYAEQRFGYVWQREKRMEKCASLLLTRKRLTSKMPESSSSPPLWSIPRRRRSCRNILP